MKTARLFKNGQSHAVRLPKDFRFEGDRVFIKKEADVVFLIPEKKTWDPLVKSLGKFSHDFMSERNRPETQKRKELLDEFILPLEIASFNKKAAETYGLIRSQLEKTGKPIGSLDTLIGAQALCLGVTLVTNNTREFKRIKNLKVVDWTA